MALAATVLPTHAQPSRQLDDVRAMASAGAVDLALERIERTQPRQPFAPGWDEWEAVRLHLLLRRHRYADVLTRFNTHAGDAGRAGAPAALLVAAAAAAAELGRFAEARNLLLRSFLASDIGAEDYRVARRTAIDTYFGAMLADAGYLAMLRFRQDFAPLQGVEVEGFVAGLIHAGRIDEAAGWLTQLDPASPSGALLRLRAGLITPAAAAARARDLVVKGDAAGWTLLAAVGRAAADPEIELEVLEGGLNERNSTAASQLESRAALWKAYGRLAERTANEAQLLAGDDVAWMAAAERLRPKRPRSARALVAALVVHARTAALRAQAQSLLAAWLREAGLARTAWRLFADADRFPLASLDARVRFELGELAAEIGEADAGLRFWEGLPPMDGMSRQQWRARHLALLLQAQRFPEVARQAAGALDPTTRLDAPSVQRLLRAAAEALERGHGEAARIVLQGLVAHTDDAQRMSVLAALARTYQAGGDYRAAAETYLLAAASVRDPAADPAAVAAREAAAASLLRAGLYADARAVWEWIARNAGSAETRQAAVRKLSRL